MGESGDKKTITQARQEITGKDERASNGTGNDTQI